VLPTLQRTSQEVGVMSFPVVEVISVFAIKNRFQKNPHNYWPSLCDHTSGW